MSTTQTPGAHARIKLIDALRGLSILLMVFYHFAYDLTVYGYLPSWLLYNDVLGFLQPFFAGVFILLSGVSCRFSRSNKKRGAITLAFALALTLVTWLAQTFFQMENTLISFGILHFLGLAALIYGFAQPLLDQIPVRVQPVVYGALALAGLALFPLHVNLPHLWALGFTDAAFSSADYFPLLKWFFLFLLGTWLGIPILQRRLPEWFYSFDMPFLPAAGRHTLLIYLLHQPVLTGIVLLMRHFLG